MSARKDLPMDRVAAEYERGDSLPVLGSRYGVDPETIRRRLLQYGTPIRNQRTAQRVRYGRHGDVQGLAIELGMTQQRVVELLCRYGITYDKRGVA